MATPDILDFEVLLAPVSEENPAGPELKEDPAQSAVYYSVKDAREAARTAERMLLAWDSEEGTQASTPDWGVVADRANKALPLSKDLWITAWLIEALAREHGFAGLRDGFRLARELVEQYWDGIHPRPDEEDGAATTVAQLTGLNGEDSEGALIAPIYRIPITQAGSNPPLNSADFRQAGEVQQITDPEKQQQRIDQGAVTLAMFDKAVSESDPQFFRNLYEDIEQCLEEFNRLNTSLEERCGRNAQGDPVAPPSSSIRRAIEDSRDRLMSIARSIIEQPVAEEVADSGEPANEDSEGEGAMSEPGISSGGKIRTRDEAFRVLERVADYFRRMEPHSPVSYSLEQAVRWGRMSLPDLLNELVADDSVRQEMFRRTGITRADGSES